MAITRQWNKLTDDAEVQNLYCPGLILGNVIQASQVIAGSISGTLTPLTPPFIYTAAGTENPAGFPVAFPSGARGGATYVAVVQYGSGAVDFVLAAAPPSSYGDAQITVKTSAQLALGDKVAIVIIDT